MPDLVLEHVDIMPCPFRLWNDNTYMLKTTSKISINAAPSKTVPVHYGIRKANIQMLSKTTEVYYRHVPRCLGLLSGENIRFSRGFTGESRHSFFV